MYLGSEYELLTINLSFKPINFIPLLLSRTLHYCVRSHVYRDRYCEPHCLGQEPERSIYYDRMALAARGQTHR